MTVLLINEVDIDLTEPIIIKESDLMRGSGIDMYDGDILSLKDAVEAALISSSNTCSHAIARYVGYKIIEK